MCRSTGYIFLPLWLWKKSIKITLHIWKRNIHFNLTLEQGLFFHTPWLFSINYTRLVALSLSRPQKQDSKFYNYCLEQGGKFISFFWNRSIVSKTQCHTTQKEKLREYPRGCLSERLLLWYVCHIKLILRIYIQVITTFSRSNVVNTKSTVGSVTVHKISTQS